ncbi:glutathione S-transferase [Acrasis kona]|uniref:glutathione transferase n=1 Tax=Acrasis kona TaxID=1008807 RepID=A0AAW2YQ83_9EUKA
MTEAGKKGIVLHHLNNSRSQRILWLLEELGIEYELKIYKRVNGVAPPELKQVHPLGKSPVITDGDTVIAESAVIIEYLINKFGKFQPPQDEALRNQYNYWMHYAEGSLMTPLVVKLIMSTIQHQAPWYVRPISNGIVGSVDNNYLKPTLDSHFDFVESSLANAKEWFVGDELTGADFQMSFPLEASASRVDLSNRPSISAYIQRIHNRPAYKRALEKGGPYNYA